MAIRWVRSSSPFRIKISGRESHLRRDDSICSWTLRWRALTVAAVQLFTFYIRSRRFNSLVQVVITPESSIKAISPGVECSLYVDDFLIVYRSKYIHIIERHLQRSLNMLSQWTVRLVILHLLWTTVQSSLPTVSFWRYTERLVHQTSYRLRATVSTCLLSVWSYWRRAILDFRLNVEVGADGPVDVHRLCRRTGTIPPRSLLRPLVGPRFEEERLFAVGRWFWRGTYGRSPTLPPLTRRTRIPSLSVIRHVDDRL